MNTKIFVADSLCSSWRRLSAGAQRQPDCNRRAGHAYPRNLLILLIEQVRSFDEEIEPARNPPADAGVDAMPDADITTM